MAPTERVHTGDIFIAVVVISSQLSLGSLFFRVWKKALSFPVFCFVSALLFVVWVVCALAIYLNAVELRILPPLISAAMSAIEILWSFTSALVITVYLAARAVIRHAPPAHLQSRRKLVQTAATAAVLAPVAAIGYGTFVERTSFRIREVDLPMPNLHPDLEGLRVAQLSDIHAGPFLSIRDLGRAVEMANELKPNLTLVTGDLITQRGDPLDAAIAQIARLRAEAGVLGCLGNHEIYAECEDYVTREAARRGIDFLRSSARPLKWGNATLNVAGVDFQPFRHKDRYLIDTAKFVAPGAANLLLSHNPDVFPLAVRQGFDAVLSGHTHGGQVTVEIVKQTLNFARFFTPYVAGLYRLNSRSCYVTAGIGTIGAPVRVGAPPEIALLRLRRA